MIQLKRHLRIISRFFRGVFIPYLCMDETPKKVIKSEFFCFLCSCNLGKDQVRGRFPFRKKNPEISVGAKVAFPIGKKLFHLVVNPGTSRCPTVDLELVKTTRNVNGTRHSVQKFQRAHLFRFSTFSGNFPVGRTDETCFIYR